LMTNNAFYTLVSTYITVDFKKSGNSKVLSICLLQPSKFLQRWQCYPWPLDCIQEPILRSWVTTLSLWKFTSPWVAQSVFSQKYFLLLCKNALAYYNSGVIVANSKVVGLALGKIWNLDLAVRPEELLSAPLRTMKLAPVTETKGQKVRGPFLTSPLGANFDPRGEVVPQGWICPLGVKLSPAGEILCLPLHYYKQ
jgi:hypothetical protein